MKLHSFRIKKYKSITDTGEVLLSDHDNITVLAGQNESGKSSVLEALDAYENDNFEKDSKPFSTESSVTQSVSCTYEIEDSDNFISSLSDSIKEEYEITDEDIDLIFDEEKMKKITQFTLSRSFSTEENESRLDVNDEAFNIIKASILTVKEENDVKKEDGTVEKEVTEKKLIDLDNEKDMPKVADIFRNQTPNILLFNDFCDLLPDRITLASLKTKKKDTKGYDAVKNLEKLLNIDFVKLYEREDLERGAIEDEHNQKISVDFQKSWGQKIHNTNKIDIKYDFQKKNTDDESYVNFYTETKDRQRLKPHQRSKGLIWFLSFWLELKAQNSKDQQLIILADEPGLYLHVKAQEDILKLFEQLAGDGHQIVYTTHSPNLIEVEKLSRINLVINDQKNGTLLESVTTSKIDTKNKQDALQPIANAIGFSVSDFGLSSKKSVILEGISDFFYYSAMRQLLKREVDYTLVPGIGVRKQKTLVSFCIGYGIDWFCVFDDDSSRGNDSQNTFEDIKKYFFEEDVDSAERKMYLTENISCVENMFTKEDINLIDNTVQDKATPEKMIGGKRKVLFSKLFHEKVMNGEITEKNISKNAKENFKKVFDWIEQKS